MILPDLLRPHLKVVFCGTAASMISARKRAYYANPTNYFWRTLFQVGLIASQFQPKEFPQLLDYGIGLTDIAKHAVGNDSDLSRNDYDAEALRQKILQYQPKMLAFTSKKAASEFLKQPTAKISYGLQTDRLDMTRFWVLTSPSGAARRYWDISIWQSLADTVGKLSDSL